jgi:hypothetical protein
MLFIVLCLEAGIALTLLPWISFGSMSDWGSNYLLTSLVQMTGSPVLHDVISSGWVRGAVTALGLLNLFIAFWEIAHFNQSLEAINARDARYRKPQRSRNNA